MTKPLGGRWGHWLIVFLCALMAAFSGVSTLDAQSASYVAFINSSGQLVVSSADGGYRWIVTNPGETLVNGYRWSGSRLFFVVNDGSGISVRVGDVNAQRVDEIGRGAGARYTGDAFTGERAYVSMDGLITVYPGGSTFAGELPVDPQGDTLLARADGQYVLIAPDGTTTPLGAVNDPNAPFVALWSAGNRLVAYADYGFGSGLAVTHPASGETVTLSSEGSIPVIPLAWVDTSLIYRGTGGTIRLVDLSCLGGGCADPFAAAVDVLPGSATDVQTDGRSLYYHDGEIVAAVDLGCVGRGDCLSSAQIVGTQAAPDTVMRVSGGVLVYTGYNTNPNDPADRTVRAVDLSCVGGTCQPVSVSSGTAGSLSTDGNAVVVQDSAGGLSAVSLSSGAVVYLSDSGDLADALWST